MTGPLLNNKGIRYKYVIALGKNSMHYRRRQKHVLRTTNMRIS